MGVFLGKSTSFLGEHLLKNKALIFTVNFYPLIAFNHCFLESQSQFLLLLPKMKMLGRATPFSWRSKGAEPRAHSLSL